VTALAALAGLGVAVGLWFALDGLRPLPAVDRPSPRPTIAWQRVKPDRLVAAGACGLVALLVTRWPVAALGAGVAGWFLPVVVRRARRRRTDTRTEAIALWAEMLRDAIGTARGIEGVLVATAPTAPLPIRAELQTMARRLEYEPLDAVLDDLGDDLDHPIGDLVVTALRLSASAGARQVRNVLADLATAAYAEAESHRRVDVARERPRAAMRYTAAVIGGFVVLLIVFSGDYLHPYGTPLGQVVLAFVALYWGCGFWWMYRMGRLAPVERFLAKPAVDQ
jgi:Flp pilus assembly protein TadB